MSGGLVQIVNYGNQDLTLTGKPEISFFKSIYKRYTNFGKKTYEISFDNPVDFGLISTITIPKKTADLLSKVILKIKLPEIDLKELNVKYIKKINNSSNGNSNDYFIYYNYLILFINKLKNVVNVFFKNNSGGSISYIQDLKTFIQSYINNSSYIQFFSTVSFFFNKEIKTDKNFIDVTAYTNASLFKQFDKNLVYIYENFNENVISYELFKYTILQNMNILDELNAYIYNNLTKITNNTEYITCGWIQKIGIYILKNLEFKIGSNVINKFSNDYINNYGDLNYTNKELYNTIIGNEQPLNQESVSKDTEILYLPIPLWFNNNYGLALPLISTQYSTIQIKINLSKIIDCLFVTVPLQLQEFKAEIFNDILTKTINIFKSHLQITMLTEYIFLDSVERKKFAQHAHEYLITQVQELNFENVNNTNNSFNLDYFHCCKEIFWLGKQYKSFNNILEKNKPSQYFVELITKKTKEENEYIDYLNILYSPFKLFIQSEFLIGLSILNSQTINTDAINKLYFRGGYDNKFISPFIQTTLSITGTELANFESNFYNYLQPYIYYKSTPQLGLNVYSFALFPTEKTQPSGTINFSRIPQFTIKINTFIDNKNYDSSFNNNNNNNLNDYQLITQVVNYNVLRFIGGYAGCAYTYTNY